MSTTKENAEGAVSAAPKNFWAIFGKIVLSLLIIPLSFFGRLILETKEQAMVQIRDWHSANISIDILLAAFGILIGILLLGETAADATLKKLGISLVILFFAFFAIIVLCSLFPYLEIYSRDNIIANLIFPNFLGLLVLGYFVQVQR